ncbi:MAG TPA: YfhO family protein [Vicinamibacteria bacterium]|nr:YfhO family protein [Vicinamibacteria bacterium]
MSHPLRSGAAPSAGRPSVPTSSVACPSPVGRRELAAVAALLTAMIVTLLPGPLLRGETLFRRDVNMIWLPQAESFVRAVASGAWPLWDPWRTFGLPLLADPRAEVAYPPTWLNLLVPPGTYYTAFVAGHLLLGGMGMHLLARRRMGRLASATAAAVFVASGPVLSLGTMWHQLAGVAWMPWVILALERCVAGASRGVVLLGLAFGAQVIAGSPDFSAATLLVAAVFVAFHLARRSLDRRGLARLAAGLALGTALSAAQWMATVGILAGTARSQGAAGSDVAPLSPPQLVEVLLPFWWNALPLSSAAQAAILDNLEPYVLSVYLGAPALAVAAAGLMGGVHPWRAPLAVVLLGSLGAALGRWFVVYPALVTLLPPLEMIRYPVKAVVPAAFATALLAGLGMEALPSARPAAVRRMLLPGAALLAAALVLVGVLHLRGAELLAPLLAPAPEAPRALAGQLPPVLIACAALAFVVAAYALAAGRPSPALAVVVAAVCVAELLYRHQPLNPPAPPALWSLRPAALAQLEGLALPRVYVHDYSLSPGWVDAWHDPRAYTLARAPVGWPLPAAQVAAVHGYMNPPTATRWAAGSYDADTLGLYPSYLERLVSAIHRAEGTPAHLRLLQLGAVDVAMGLIPQPWWSDLEPMASHEGLLQLPVRVFRVPGTRPRAWVAAGVRVAADEAALAVLLAPSFDPATEIVLASGAPRPPGRGLASVGEYAADRVVVDVETDGEAHLLLADTWYPGWRATVDGRPAPVRRANLAFRAVPVPAGRHRVEMVYRPPAALAGVAISAVTLAALALVGLGAMRRPPPPLAPGSPAPERHPTG